MIVSYVESINKPVVQKYCENDTLNDILSDFARRCRDNDIQTLWQIEPDPVSCDAVLLSTILSNALDNAINAQLELPEEKRRILLLLKQQNKKQQSLHFAAFFRNTDYFFTTGIRISKG